MTLINLDTLTLASGGHNNRDEVCLMEAVAWFAGEKHSAEPRCVSPVLRRFGIRLNDMLPDAKRQLLVPLIPTLVGTAGDGLDEVRRYMAVDWAVRVAAPMWMDAAGRSAVAAELRALAPIVNEAGRQAIRPRLREIADETWAARREALAKVRASAKGSVAAAAAVADAVADAAAAADAAADAAAAAVAAAVAAADADAAAVAAAVAVAAAGKTWTQVYDEVYKQTKARILATLAPTIDQVHDSAIDLYSRMVNPARREG